MEANFSVLMGRLKIMGIILERKFFSEKERKVGTLFCSEDKHLPPESSTPHENLPLRYRVGAYDVQIVRSNGVYEYRICTKKELGDLHNLIESRLEEIILLMRKGADAGDVLTSVLGIPREKVPDALFVLRSILEYGKIQALLGDAHIQDISIEGADRVWIRHSLIEKMDEDQDFIPTNIFFQSVEEVLVLQQIIATKCNVYVSMSNPIVEAQLPAADGGHRVHLVFPSISQNRPEIVIRKRLQRPPSIKNLSERGVIPDAAVELLRGIIAARASAIIAGPPGSGKTTLLRSILHYLVPRTWKVLVIEDTGEIDPPPGSPWTKYTTFELGSVKIDLFDLAKASLRASGTKIIVVGETRGSEAQVLSQAMLVGLGALTTFHGSSPSEVISRLMSPPINLRAPQIGMFQYLFVLGFGKSPRRQLKSLSELSYSVEKKMVEHRVIWSREVDGMKIDPEEMLRRSERWKELLKRSMDASHGGDEVEDLAQA
ncbi:MAG: type II/IV secretion system ATPase subunit [Fervidicoccaceae archaeon]